MKHLLTIRHAEIQFGEGRADRNHASDDFARSMAEAGILVGTDQPERAGGSYVIDVPSTDAALDWAARFAGAARAAIEVRPIWAWAGMG